MIARIIRWLVVTAVVVTVAGAIFFRMADDDPALWHVDPATIERTGKPNDYLVAPEGATKAAPDRIAKMRAAEPRDLLFQFDAVARPSGATIIAGSVDEGWVTYVQRTMILGFPDYISVKAIPVEGGSALIIWSRSRYGTSDFGVNKKRIDGWLTQMGDD